MADISDSDLKLTIAVDLGWNEKVNAKGIEVTVNDGIVQLNGSVPEFFSKSAAYETVSKIEGVRNIIDNLHVNYPPDFTLPPDELIRSSISNSLLWNPFLNLNELDIQVSQGEVTINGIVDNLWKKKEVEAIITNTFGVKLINDYLKIEIEKVRPDKDILHDISFALSRRVLTCSHNIVVLVENSKVVLQGSVPNFTSLLQAYETALYTNSVKQIDNQIHVKF